MGYCGSISRNAPICPSTDRKTSNAQLSNSTPAHEKRSAGIPQPSACVIYYYLRTETIGVATIPRIRRVQIRNPTRSTAR